MRCGGSLGLELLLQILDQPLKRLNLLLVLLDLRILLVSTIDLVLQSSLQGLILGLQFLHFDDRIPCLLGILQSGLHQFLKSGDDLFLFTDGVFI